MKVYRVIDDTSVSLTTVERLKALEKFYEVSKKYDQTCFWIDEEELE